MFVYGLKLKYGAAAQQCSVNVKIGVFGRGGNKGYTAVFGVFEEGLLLLFVKILYFVKIKQNSVRSGNGVYLGKDRF